VFYGHFTEEFMLLKNIAGAEQHRFIYFYHMVLFIVLAGFVAKERDIALCIGTFLKHRLYSRRLPFLFFTVVMIEPTFFL
jgi:fucose 4-O-acetylase-like acetyltransferase